MCKSYQAMSIRGVIQGAKLFGEGDSGAFPFGNDAHTYYERIPNAGRDRFFAVMIHALGWIPFLLLICVFCLIIVWMLYCCLKQKNILRRMVACVRQVESA
jgi:cell division protein FtsW (lipid II flippase)